MTPAYRAVIGVFAVVLAAAIAVVASHCESHAETEKISTGSRRD